MSYKKGTCVNYCDGRDARDTLCPVVDRTEKARALLCCLTFKQEVESILAIICSLKLSMLSDINVNASGGLLLGNFLGGFFSEATCNLLFNLMTALDASVFIKYMPDIDGFPVWYYVFLNPHPCPLKDIPCDDLLRRKIVAVNSQQSNGLTEFSLFALCADGSGGYSDAVDVTYLQAVGELEKLLTLALEANNMVCSC